MHILDLVPARYNGFYNFLLLLLSLHPKILNTASNRDVKTSLHTFKHYLKCSDRNLYICLDAILKA